jgi:hypothetical protein
LNAPFIPQFFKDPLDQTAPYWDYILGNETEAQAYADSHDLNTHDIPTIAKHLANLPKKNTKRKRTAIITQGTEPTIVAVQGEDEVRRFPVHPIDEKEIEDTTGAGDAFAGGFFAGVAKGEQLETCVDMGQWLAALSLRELGPSCVSTSPFGRCFRIRDKIADHALLATRQVSIPSQAVHRGVQIEFLCKAWDPAHGHNGYSCFVKDVSTTGLLGGVIRFDTLASSTMPSSLPCSEIEPCLRTGPRRGCCFAMAVRWCPTPLLRRKINCVLPRSQVMLFGSSHLF